MASSRPSHISGYEPTCQGSSRRLPNGLEVVEVPQPHLRRCAISAYFRVGSRFETADENGLSHFLEHMLFRGTARHPSAFEVNRAVEYLGGNFYAATSPDTTELEMVLPRQSVGSGLALLAEILREPAFRDIDIERRIIEEEILEDFDEHGKPIDIDFLSRSRLWPDHPLGQSVIGPLRNIERFQLADIRDHYRNRYVTPNAVLCLSGAFDSAREGREVDALFSDFPAQGDATVWTSPVLGVGPTIGHAHKPGSQTQIRVAFHAPGEDAADHVALITLLGVLDDGMSSRLHRRIFDECGLAYHIGASLDCYADVAALNFDGTTSHDNIDAVIHEILDIAKELRDVVVPDDELEKARRRAAFGVEEFMDDPQSMSLWYGEQRLFRTPPSLDERIAAYTRVSGEDVLDVARRVFTPANLHVTTVGVVDGATSKRIERAVARFS